MFENLNQVIEQVGKDKGIDRETIIAALEEALLIAAKRKLGAKQGLEAQYNPESGEIEIFQFKDVVNDIHDESVEMTLEEARELDSDAEIGDSIGIKIDTSDFGRIAAQAAKQVIVQRVKDAERENIYMDYKDRKGEVVNGIIQRFEKGDIIVNLGRVEALLPRSEQVPREVYRQGDRIRAYILDVRRVQRGPQIILSRTHPNFLIMLFEIEVPEISESIVQIRSAAREPGERAKIAVSSNDLDVDPVGACVGMRGSRVQSVVQELRGERIDIIPWSDDPAKFVCSALAPVAISRVIIDEEDRSMEVIVADEQLFQAIGKKGQNVRLASKLIGWKIDVQSESKAEEISQKAYDSLRQIPGVGDITAEILFASGFQSPEEILEAGVNELAEINGIGSQKAESIFESANSLLSRSADLMDKEPSAVEGASQKLSILPGVGEKTAELLKSNGYKSLEDLSEASLEDLMGIPGIGPKKAEKIYQLTRKMKGDSDSSE